jgi:hypothetical protein
MLFSVIICIDGPKKQLFFEKSYTADKESIDDNIYERDVKKRRIRGV